MNCSACFDRQIDASLFLEATLQLTGACTDLQSLIRYCSEAIDTVLERASKSLKGLMKFGLFVRRRAISCRSILTRRLLNVTLHTTITPFCKRLSVDRYLGAALHSVPRGDLYKCTLCIGPEAAAHHLQCMIMKELLDCIASNRTQSSAGVRS